MHYRHLYPMVRLLFPFLSGIMLAIWFPFPFHISWLIPGIIAIIVFCITLLPLTITQFSKSEFYGILLSILLFFTGYNLVFSHNELLDKSHFSHQLNTNSTLIARIAEVPEEKEHSIKAILEVEGVKKGVGITKAKGKILAYFEKDSLKPLDEIGSLIVFKANPEEINKAMNPGAFDYRSYMASQNVFHQVYLPSYSWKLLQKNTNFSLQSRANKIRNYFIKILQSNGLKDKEFAVAAALMLGQKDMLDAETMQHYAGSGVVHILCVSGLHVGVIYLIISTLLSFFKKTKRQRYINAVVILVSIWAYAVLTGLSPSVMRSGAMFTFITLGNLSKRYVHIINSLAASAFCLLLINPLLISNIGFQLSYLAILGIVFIHPYILSLWSPKNKISEYIWGLISVSISAQIATSPLSLFYFHQFPLYFIPANLIAVPVSGIIIYSGLLVLITSPVAFISKIFGFISYYLILSLNFCIGFIEQLPYAVQRIYCIGKQEFILLYLIIISFLILIALKRKMAVFSILFLLIVLASGISYRRIQQMEQKNLIVYHASKNSAIGFINGKNQTLLINSAVINDEKFQQYNIKGTEDGFGINESRKINRDSLNKAITCDKTTQMYVINQQLFYFGGKRIALLDSLPKKGILLGKPLKVDYIILNKQSKFKIEQLLDFYNPKLIIIEPSVSVYKREKWIEECKNADIASYSIAINGAYIADL